MVGRSILAALAVSAGLGLSGCITGAGSYSQASVQEPGQEILDGTIRNPADWSDAPPRHPARRSAKVTIGAVKPGTDAQSASAEPPKVFSDEWWERENRENERLTRQMRICRGC